MRKVLLIVLLLSFIAYAGMNLAESVTPYVTIAEARTSSNNVQVKGLLDKNFAPVQTCDEFTFGLVDESTGETMLTASSPTNSTKLITLSRLANTTRQTKVFMQRNF